MKIRMTVCRTTRDSFALPRNTLIVMRADEEEISTKVIVMDMKIGLLGPKKYIFGDFSPDEFNQFFVTPRSSVEKLNIGQLIHLNQPRNKQAQDSIVQAVELPPYGGAVLCGTQAAAELPDGQDCQRIEFGVNEVIEPNDTLLRTPNYSISSTLNPQAPEFILSCTTSKKIPNDIDKEVNYSSADCQYPGSALALDGSSNVEAEVLENDGGGPSTEALVNGHAGPAVPNSVGTEDVDSMGDVPPVGTPRTWGSPQDTTDFVSDAVPAGSFPGALDSGARTAGQPEGCPGANLEPSRLPAEASRDTLLRTAVAQPAVGTDTTENLGAEVKEGLVPVSEDPVAIKIAGIVQKIQLLENVTLIHKPVSLQPRGLINKGNWCYINATLQALVACPPMYHLMKFIPLYSKVQRPCTSTPMIDSFVRLMNEFTNMPVPPKPRQALGDKIVRDIRPGAAFEPTYIYRLLTVIKSSLSEKGRQEDAEEYLGFILNGLHEEMLNLKKLLSPNNEKLTVSNGPRSHSVNEDEQEEPGEGSEDEWEQVGPRNKTSSSKESATLQPFFTLQLDIQSDKIRTVQDALESLVARESVQGYTTKTKQEVEISRRVTLEKLPPVLVLHLKRFVYEKTGGCQKLIKNIEYPVDLEISKELLSPGVKNKNFKCHRTYRLFAVVYHHGSSATGGHYTTDVFQIGLNGWLRIDDQTVKVINQYQVVKPAAERTAYLLYYRRVDLL
ncbi:hypothetical protein E2I00_019411 [Balaenoptera physalus]|uniref:Ubiquitin carboxyl-terminal hydrolase n=1 Tax=Balaenoptera physalus TaxID=9770 RepID=A0A643BW23_BALPH|nr:hypothetical protein E2I00_019411 [Balaenoptera physalus]